MPATLLCDALLCGVARQRTPYRFVVGVHDSALAIQVAPPPLTGFVNGKEFFVNNGPVVFRRRVFCTKILHRVQLPIGFLQKHCANRIVTGIRVNYEFLVKSR